MILYVCSEKCSGNTKFILLVTMDNSTNQVQIQNSEDHIHNQKQKYICNICHKVFILKNLMSHINSVHNGQKDHKCDSCEKSFSSSGYLKKHINSVHNGQKDHKCDSCGKVFSQAGDLKAHINAVH